MPGAAAVRRGSQFLNSITDDSEIRADSPELNGEHMNGGMRFVSKEKQELIKKRSSSRLQFGAKMVCQDSSIGSDPDLLNSNRSEGKA